MKRTLEKLWNGDIAPAKQCGEEDREIQEIMILIERNRTDLAAELNEKQKKKLERFIGCYEEYIYLISAQGFCDGFSLASKLWTEALTEN